jgi:hypothetical protein
MNPPIVAGTCFLVGMCFDSVHDSPSSAAAAANDDDESSALIQLATAGTDILHATVTYSTKYTFSFTFTDDIFKGIIYDTAHCHDKQAQINLHGLTEFFDLKYILVKEKNIIAVLRKFTNKRKQVTLLRSHVHPQLQIEPGAFYGTIGKTKIATDTGTVFESFSRQELAFKHFDTTPKHTYNPLKLFTFESLITGKRQFLVADIKSFLTRYLSLAGPKRHVYEIIRDSFPCRLYFDLEFNIPLNPDINGPSLPACSISVM